MKDSKITRYMIVSKTYPSDVVLAVNDYIDEGWQPLGSPMTEGNGVIQAVVKYEEENGSK